MRACLPMLFVAVVFFVGASASAEQAAPYDHCNNNGAALAALPFGEGPVRLLGIDCPPAGNQSASPDGQRFLSYRGSEGLVVSGLEKNGAVQSYPLNASIFSMLKQGTSIFQWASDSRSVWAADQKRTGGGFPTEPLRPVLILPDGKTQDLPTLVGPGGDLDGLLWIGRDGLALAKFGIGGDEYRPARPTPDPAMAFVDVKRGRYLGWFRFKDFPKAISAVGGPMVPLMIAEVLLQDGRPRVLFQWPSGYSLVWSQGESPREVTLPKLPWGTTIKLASDGRRLLIAYPLSATGTICEPADDEPDHCPPPTPVTGKLAQLIDLETGKTIWEIRETAKRFEANSEPVISPDGRYALIGIPQNDDDYRRGSSLIYEKIGLISMSDGSFLQSMPSFSKTYSTSFGTDQRFYIGSVGYVATYEIAEHKAELRQSRSSRAVPGRE